jgi:hypothetical protein
LSTQLPDDSRCWCSCRFLFDPGESGHGWLVVYNDLPHRRCDAGSLREEILACSRRHTLLVITELSSIKSYGRAFATQFGCVRTSQAAWALPHPDRVYSQPALHWFYGVGRDHVLGHHELSAIPHRRRPPTSPWSGLRKTAISPSTAGGMPSWAPRGIGSPGRRDPVFASCAGTEASSAVAAATVEKGRARFRSLG